MNIYMICTLWTPFQAERDWKKFLSIYSILYGYILRIYLDFLFRILHWKVEYCYTSPLSILNVQKCNFISWIFLIKNSFPFLLTPWVYRRWGVKHLCTLTCTVAYIDIYKIIRRKKACSLSKFFYKWNFKYRE